MPVILRSKATGLAGIGIYESFSHFSATFLHSSFFASTLTLKPGAPATSRESSSRYIVRRSREIIGKWKARRIRRLEILWLDARLRTGKGAILIRERTKAPRCREAPWQIRRKVSLITLYPGPEGIAVSTVTLKANGRKFVRFCGPWMGGA
jgi:hypothetical protein